MVDLSSWSRWGTLLSVLFALIPTVLRFRVVLVKIQDLIIEIAGIVILLAGLIMYAMIVPHWLQFKAQMAQQGLEVESLPMVFFGSIALMVLGGVLTLFGLMGRIAINMRHK